VARGYERAIARARRLIYVEDQYFWSAEVVRCFADALRDSPGLRLVVVLPHYPDQDGRLAVPPYVTGLQEAIAEVLAAGRDRVALYGIENHDSIPIYVHAKVCIVDDVWATVGSDNVNRRSWTHDSELTCAVLDAQRDNREPEQLDGFGTGARRFARDLRLRLTREHLDCASDDSALIDPETWFSELALSAARLQAWHDGGFAGARPPGRLRPYVLPQLAGAARLWAGPLYRAVFDPDGRPATLRRHNLY
jgi:phosphatidylserine/phosphatidylglycerophosphate/cardiolipin synthase-like enzyme